MAAAVLAAIELGQLVQVVWVSLGASVVVTGAFALVVRESGRSAEARRNGNGSAAVIHGGLALLLFASFVAIVVVGVVTMLNKD